MKKDTQFKIESVEDIINHYIRNADKFSTSLNSEVKDFKEEGMNYMYCESDGLTYVNFFDPNKELIQNPYQTKPDPTCELGKAMKAVETEANKLGWTAQISFKSNK